jgi:NAD(P)-dependent dehydrogenase (short-subunit alcohol dehydrogenase family)
LDGRTVVVVGAGSVGEGIGNGKASAIAYAREGANVGCVDFHLDRAEETVERIAAEGGTGLARPPTPPTRRRCRPSSGLSPNRCAANCELTMQISAVSAHSSATPARAHF